MTVEDDHYSSQEVGDIVRLGLRAKKDDTIDRKELLEIGSEFGLDEPEIDAAIEEHRREQQRGQRAERRQAGFIRHLYAYIGVNTLLLVTDVLTPGPWWFQWPLLGWGIGLFFHYRAVFQARNRSSV